MLDPSIADRYARTRGSARTAPPESHLEKELQSNTSAATSRQPATGRAVVRKCSISWLRGAGAHLDQPGPPRRGSRGMSLVVFLLFSAGDADYRHQYDVTAARRPGDVSNRSLRLKDERHLGGAPLIDGEVCVGLNTSLIGAGDE